MQEKNPNHATYKRIDSSENYAFTAHLLLCQNQALRIFVSFLPKVQQRVLSCSLWSLESQTLNSVRGWLVSLQLIHVFKVCPSKIFFMNIMCSPKQNSLLSDLPCGVNSLVVKSYGLCSLEQVRKFQITLMPSAQALVWLGRSVKESLGTGVLLTVTGAAGVAEGWVNVPAVSWSSGSDVHCWQHVLGCRMGFPTCWRAAECVCVPPHLNYEST